jgi:hypothetical protein
LRRKLTIPQLTALVQFNWNDAAGLEKVEEALPADDPAADELRQSVAERIAKLKAAEGEVVLAPRSIRKLNLKQLVTLAEVYWDDPAKLAEILDALRSRLEPEADALFRSVARRINLLKNDPKAAAAEPPPSAAADSEGGIAETVADAAATPQRWRRLPLFVLTGALAAAVAAWLLWPHDTDEKSDVVARPGAEVLAEGERPDDEVKPPAERAGEPASVPPRPFSDLRPPPQLPATTSGRSPPGREVGGGRADTASSAEARAGRDSDARSGAAAGGGSAGRPREPASPRSAAAAARGASPPLRQPATAVGPEAGIAVEDARLNCYRTNSSPGGCLEPAAARPRDEPPPSAGAAPADSARSAARGAAPSPRPAASLDTSGAAPSSPPAAPRGSAPAAAAVPSGGGIGGGGVGANAAADSGGSGAAPAPRAQATRTTRASGGGATEAAQKIPQPPLSRAAMPPQSSDADCPPQPPSGRVVFILDGSVSMGLPLDVDASLEDELDEGIRRHDPEARRDYRALLAEPGPKRITRAREAFTTAVAELPAELDLGLVVFQECRDIRKVGIFEAARRGAAIDYIKAMIPKGRTPLADSLRTAAEMLGDGKSSIVLLTDGREFCGGDPCAAAAEIKAGHPDTPVHVIDITGQAKAECIAERTGGRSYKPEATDDLAQVVRAAFRGADAQCMAPADPPASDAKAQR